ncbi:contactin-like [Pomacea canaliculata]|uniref:contactin-like n=1 Tax=Pomacea canaliculata TaxID=400727 RepID=UPI000D72E52A|nr:contactin-like [Pomacea canaliculata]XP_025080703.1 contactin-like [Pomacea canaliculata]
MIISFAFLLASLTVVTCQQQFQYDCPIDWPSFGTSCYHFVFYPERPFDEAAQACRYDGSGLVSINTPEEHQFIVSWLNRNGIARQSDWYTSGVDQAGKQMWEGDGQPLVGETSYWVTDNSQVTLYRQLVERRLVYQYTETRKTYGWAWTNRTRLLPYICEISRQEVYRVYQQNRDFSFGSDTLNPNDWPVGPNIVQQSPSVVFVDETDFANVECSAVGNPNPTYQWFRDYGTPRQVQITGQMNSRYAVTNGRLSIHLPKKETDTGDYTCVAQNPSGKVFSAPIKISSGFLGEFSNDKPGSRTAIRYQGSVVDCLPPSFNPALSFQWMKANRFLRPEMNPHTFLSENGKLYFSEVQDSDAAEYHCIVTLVALPGQILATAQPLYRNSLGIELRVQGDNPSQFGPDIHNDFPAVFPKEPVVGQEMRLECLAYGRLPLYYSWSRKQGELPVDRTSYDSLNRVLRISNVRLEDSGTYTCSVKGVKNTANSTITINVHASPYFLFPLRNQHLDVGSQLTWVCDAVAIPSATYTWYKDGEILVTDTGKDVMVTGNVLKIGRAEASKHNGMYECVAQNVHGTNTSSAQVRVLGFQPSFTKMPVANQLMGAVGGNLTIQCQPEAAPPPIITWTHNGSPVGSGGRGQQTVFGDLVLSGLTLADSGNYTCTAENSFGSASSSGQLRVVTTTVLSYAPQSQEVLQNETAYLSCQASYAVSRTDLVYVWYFNDVLLDMDLDPSYKIGEMRGINGLYIVGSQFKHEGWYECRATSVFDSIGAKAYLTVKGPPEEPAGVHIRNKQGTQVELWWQPGKTRGDSITQYRIEFRSDFNQTWRNLVTGISAADTQINEYPQWRTYTIREGLSPGTSYQFRVAAASQNFGYGPLSSPSEITKLDDAPPVFAPSIVTGGGGSVSMLTIKWTPLPKEQHGGNGLYYRAHWRLHGSETEKWEGSKDISHDTAEVDRNGMITYSHYLPDREKYYTQYDVKVQASNTMGPGPNTSVEVIYSAEDLPTVTPQKVNAININATAAKITWEMTTVSREDVRGRILGYQVNYWLITETMITSWYYRQYGEAQEAVIIGLKGNGDYWVNVQVFNSAGLSRPSGDFYLNPYYDPPHHYPEYVTVMSDGPESVRVSWRGVSYVLNESPTLGYKIWWWPYTDDIRTANEATFGKEYTGVLHGVQKDIVYVLRVMATSLGGDGTKSPATLFTLGGQVRFNPLTSEIFAAAGVLHPCSFLLFLCSIAAMLSRILQN